MGEMYRARDTRIERNVAITILPAAFSSDPFVSDQEWIERQVSPRRTFAKAWLVRLGD